MCFLSPIGGSIYQKPASMEKPWLGGCSRRLPEENNKYSNLQKHGKSKSYENKVHCDK